MSTSPKFYVAYKIPSQIVGVLMATSERDARIYADGKWGVIHSIEEIAPETLEHADVVNVVSIDYSNLDGKPVRVRRGW